MRLISIATSINLAFATSIVISTNVNSRDFIYAEQLEGGVPFEIIGSLEIGDQNLGDRLADSYHFTVISDQKVSIEIESKDFSPYLLLTNEQNEVLAGQNEVFFDENSAWLLVRLVTGRNYILHVMPAVPEGQGEYELAINVANSYDEIRAEANESYQQGRELYESGQFTEAIQKFHNALSAFQRIGDKDGELRNLNAIGVALTYLERHDEAIEYYLESLEIAREIGDNFSISQVLLNLGFAYDYKQEFSRSLPFYEELIELSLLSDDGSIVEFLWLIAEAKRTLGENLDALKYYEDLLQYTQDSGEFETQVDALNSMGETHRIMGQTPQALEYYQQALLIADRIDYKRDTILNNIGVAYVELGQYSEAISSLEIALGISIQLQDLSGQATILSNIGAAYHKLEDYTKSLDLYQQALSIRRNLGYKKGVVENLINIGSLLNKLGDSEQAQTYLEEARSYIREIDDVRISLDILIEIGESRLTLGKYLEALEVFQEALELSQENNISPSLELLHLLGTAYMNVGDYQRSSELFERSLRIAQSSNDSLSEAIVFNSIGVLYRNRGEYQEALETYQQALAMAEELESFHLQANVFNNLGLLYNLLGQYSQGIEFLEKSLMLRRNLGLRFEEVQTLNNIANLYSAINRQTKVSEFLETSLLLARDLGYPEGENIALNGFARLYIESGEYDEAVNILENVLVYVRSVGDRSGEANVLLNLGDAYKGLGDKQSALNSYREALDMLLDSGTFAEQGAAFSSIGTLLFEEKQYVQATEYYRNAIEISQKTGNLQAHASSLSSLAAIAMLQGNYEKAKILHYDSVEILENLRSRNLSDLDKISLLAAQFNVYEGLQQNLILLEDYYLALEISERSRARAFVELIQARSFNAESAEASYQFPDVSQIKSIAQESNSTLVEYSVIDSGVGQPELYAWVISRNGEISFRRQPLTDIDLTSLVTDTRDVIGVRGDRNAPIPTPTPQHLAQLRAETDQKLTQLHDLLIGPISDLLPTDPNQPVVFIPQGELFQIPFPALKNADGEYLIENHTILTAPSIQVLQLTRGLAERTHNGSPLQSDNAVIVGNPTMPTVTFLNDNGDFQDVRLNPLFGAQQEAEAISDFLETPALIGENATEAAVKQQIASADLIHLATHGLLEYGDPRETGTRDTPGAIALAPGNGEDGLLTSAEILQMDLQADLVVLSACDTGRGRITGDGVIGLSRSFVAAGVPSIIVSLWAVPDAPTAELMTEFYRQLDQGQTKAQALRQAMLITMQTHPDPKDWAAFTLIGESE
ncbi:MAG: tetratricopeptide repeat protein [Leptolyngbya sp. SIO1E4]|nr:tetratricopeptide repeat protein [Leptolyngbya sp. SIO1E4]